MPNIFAINTRTLEIVSDRFDRWFQGLQQQQQDTNSAPQREKRAAYEMVRDLTGEAYAVARQQFDAQYGPDEYRRQQALGIRRDERAQP